MEKTRSEDGTAVAFDRLGDGPPVILVGGGFTDRMTNAPPGALLAEHPTVHIALRTRTRGLQRKRRWGCPPEPNRWLIAHVEDRWL